MKNEEAYREYQKRSKFTHETESFKFNRQLKKNIWILYLVDILVIIQMLLFQDETLMV